MKKITLLVLLFILVCTPVIANAQSDADFLFEDYEEFYETDIIDGPWVYHSDNLTVYIKRTDENGFLCYIAEIYIRNNERAYTGWARMQPGTCSAELPHKIARRYDAIFGITGDFVRHSGNRKGVMIRDGVVYFDKKNADTLAVLPSGEMQVYQKGTVTADELLALGITDTLSFGPIIVDNHNMTDAVSTHPLKPKNFRSGVGKIEAGYYIAIVPQCKLTFKEYAQIFLNYGCEWAYNLDGGHSASMVIMGEQVNVHRLGVFNGGTLIVRQRPIPDVLLLGKSGLVPCENEKPRYDGSR